MPDEISIPQATFRAIDDFVRAHQAGTVCADSAGTEFSRVFLDVTDRNLISSTKLNEWNQTLKWFKAHVHLRKKPFSADIEERCKTHLLSLKDCFLPLLTVFKDDCYFSMKSFTPPTSNTVDLALRSINRNIDRRHFYIKLENPHWVVALEKRKVFKDPPPSIQHDDKSIQWPWWPELAYVLRVTPLVPLDAVRVAAEIPKTDNPRVYHQILEIALALKNPELSVQLLDKISGPNKQRFVEWMGKDFTEEEFARRQAYFQKAQFWPFEAVLFGKYKEHFARLTSGETPSLDTYGPRVRSLGEAKFVQSQSLITKEDLADKTDEGLVQYLNDWSDAHHTREDGGLK